MLKFVFVHEWIFVIFPLNLTLHILDWTPIQNSMQIIAVIDRKGASINYVVQKGRTDYSLKNDIWRHRQRDHISKDDVVSESALIFIIQGDKIVLTQRRCRLLKNSPSVYVVKCRFSMNSLSVPFGRRSLWTLPHVKKLDFHFENFC